MKTVPSLFVASVFLIMVAGLLAPRTIGACEQCRWIPGAYPGEWWCTYTDCTASNTCWDVPDHSYCIPSGGCIGTLPKWLCELYPSAPCQEDPGTSLAKVSQEPETPYPLVLIGEPEDDTAIGSKVN